MGTMTTEAPLHSALAEDPDLREIVEMFVDEMPQRTDLLQSQLKTHDWEQLQRTAHQLKGAAGSYGFDLISPSAGQLEELLRDGEPESEVKKAVDQLISLCRRITAEPAS